MKYPIEKKFGRYVPVLVESSASFNSTFAILTSRQQPFKVKQRSNPSTSQKFEEVLCSLISPIPDQVEVTISKSQTFSNDSAFQSFIGIDEFLEYSGGFKMYIAQFPLYQRLKASDFIPENEAKTVTQNRKSLEKLKSSEYAPPSYFPSLNSLRRVNLWASKSRTKSALHFDFYSNFLQVKKGRKTIFLFPPDCKKLIKNDYFDEFKFHQGKLSKARFYNQVRGGKRNRFNNLFDKGMVRVDLLLGEIVHIPEGWHHLVISQPGTIAINFWYESIFEKIESNRNSILKRLVQLEVRDKIKKICKGCFLERFQVDVPPHKIKRFIINLLVDRKLDIQGILKSEITKEKLILIHLLDVLEESDQKLPAGILDRDSQELNLSQSNFFKENFYTVFGLYFTESDQKEVLALKRNLFKQVLSLPIASLFN